LYLLLDSVTFNARKIENTTNVENARTHAFSALLKVLTGQTIRIPDSSVKKGHLANLGAI